MAAPLIWKTLSWIEGDLLCYWSKPLDPESALGKHSDAAKLNAPRDG